MRCVASAKLARRPDIRELRLLEAKFREVFRHNDYSKKSIKSLICVMCILMDLLLRRMHLSHIAEDVTNLTLSPVMVAINFLMKTDEEFPVSHHVSLSCVLS